MNKSKLPFSWLSRLILTNSKTLKPYNHPTRPLHSISQSPLLIRHSSFNQARNFCSRTSISQNQIAQGIQQLLQEVEREKHEEREAKRKAGIFVDDNEEEEDYLGVQPLIDKLDKLEAKEKGRGDREPWEDSESESEDDDDDQDRADDMKKKEDMLLQRKVKRHQELIQEFEHSGQLF